MCGINGIVRLNTSASPVDIDEVRRVRDSMARRGPDGSGDWLSPDGSVGFGHRRLAIIDLSDAGAQPMQYGSGRYWITFNGEIYNYESLRDELMAAGCTFQSHCDTEVILALYACHGPAMLSRLRGMFAFALWDDVDKTLLLARDPYGIKPLYYTDDGQHLRFASQVRALAAGAGVSSDVDPAGLAGFLLWGSVPEPYTIRRGVKALPAGHYLTVRDGRAGQPVAYARFDPFEELAGANSDAAGTVARAVEDSVGAHLVADVPVAVFLSAGMDSSMIAALAARHTGEAHLQTITLAFDSFRGTPFDEAPLAAETARKLGTDHIERRVSRDDFIGLWDDALAAMDQPTIDGINTYVISRVVHDAGLKVVLSGLGGDELFGSYASFRDVPRWAMAGRIGGKIPGMRHAFPLLARRFVPSKPKLTRLMDHGTLAGSYYLRRGLFLPEDLPGIVGPALAAEGLAAYEPVSAMQAHVNEHARDDSWLAVHLMESGQYLRNQLLRDADWASMAHSLELRVPLVDATLRRAVAAQKFQPARTGGKQSVARAAAPELPEAVWNRPKSGFFIPVLDWLDDRSGKATGRWGRDSRLLARRVLAGFGIDVS